MKRSKKRTLITRGLTICRRRRRFRSSLGRRLRYSSRSGATAATRNPSDARRGSGQQRIKVQIISESLHGRRGLPGRSRTQICEGGPTVSHAIAQKRARECALVLTQVETRATIVFDSRPVSDASARRDLRHSLVQSQAAIGAGPWSVCSAPFGGSVDPFVEQLKRLCRDYPTRAKWVFVPGHAIGRTIGERIARDGTNWLNLRFVTPLDIALQMGAPFLVDRGIDPSEEGLGPALMMRLLLDLPPEGGYFRPLAQHPTLDQALWTTMRELRMAGVRPAALKPEMFSSPAKQAELVALFTAYERFLDENKRADMASV